MKPDFSDIQINSAVKQTAATSENQDVWNTPEGIPVKKHFTKEDISEAEQLVSMERSSVKMGNL